jgi:SAM-dependent methyltransferase
MATRIDCRCCGSKNIQTFLDLGKMPLAGGFLSSKDDQDIKYDLKINFCHDCSLVQISNVIDPEILFQNYSFSSSTVKPLHDHFDSFAEWLISKTNGKKFFEFGCNDGIFLEKLNKRQVNTLGIDPSKNITDIARSKKLDVITGYFNTNSVESILSEYGMFDVVSGSNVFAHNNNPSEILNSANLLLNDNGFLCLEVMYAYDLFEKFQWDTLYHEHLTFYSIKTIKDLLKRFGFKVIDAERIPMHGGSLRILATKNNEISETNNLKKLISDEESIHLNDFSTWINFGTKASQKINIVKNIFSQISKNSNVWAYGAAGKSTLWINACEMNYLNGVADSSPLRAGKFVPGTKTEIFYPDYLKSDKPDIIFITAWNYKNNIVENEKWFDGLWAVPLPDLSFF